MMVVVLLNELLNAQPKVETKYPVRNFSFEGVALSAPPFFVCNQLYSADAPNSDKPSSNKGFGIRITVGNVSIVPSDAAAV